MNSKLLLVGVLLAVGLWAASSMASEKEGKKIVHEQYVQFDAKTRALINQWLDDRYLPKDSFVVTDMILLRSKDSSIPQMYMTVSPKFLERRDYVYKSVYAHQGLKWGSGCGALAGALADYYNVGQFSESFLQRPRWFTSILAVAGSFVGGSIGMLRYACAKMYRDEGVTVRVHPASGITYLHLHGLHKLLSSHKVEPSFYSAFAEERLYVSHCDKQDELHLFLQGKLPNAELEGRMTGRSDYAY